MVAQTITPGTGFLCQYRIQVEDEGFFGVSRHVHGHQNTACRAGTHLKRRHCATPESSFIVRSTRVTVSLFSALLRDA
ncbi:hypothetical protein TNCV_4655831 [Trichonephila clavipes]|nr:hypothetical protein TNCV_4655831 [Trichonephila clavipes]